MCAKLPVNKRLCVNFYFASLIKSWVAHEKKKDLKSEWEFFRVFIIFITIITLCEAWKHVMWMRISLTLSLSENRGGSVILATHDFCVMWSCWIAEIKRARKCFTFTWKIMPERTLLLSLSLSFTHNAMPTKIAQKKKCSEEIYLDIERKREWEGIHVQRAENERWKEWKKGKEKVCDKNRKFISITKFIL